MRHKLLLLSILTLSLITSACNSSSQNVLDLNQKIYMENISAFCNNDSKNVFKCIDINYNPITGIIIFQRFNNSIMISEYKDGYSEGKSIIYDNNGIKKLEQMYKNRDIVNQKFYYPNGKIHLEMGNNINKGYYENGQVHYETIDGIYKEYDKTGKLLKANKTN